MFASSPSPAESVAESALSYEIVAVPVAVCTFDVEVVIVAAPAEPVALLLGPLVAVFLVA